MSLDYTSATVHFPKTKRYPYERNWDLETIWNASKNAKPTRIKVSELWDKRYKNEWCWQNEGEELNNLFFLHHMRRVLNADLSYPIMISEEGLIFDGVHRLDKAKHLDLEYIDCLVFEKDPVHNR